MEENDKMAYSNKLKVSVVLLLLLVSVVIGFFFYTKFTANKVDASDYVNPFNIKFSKDTCPGIINIQWVNGPETLPGGTVLQGGVATFKIISTDLNDLPINRSMKLRIISLTDNSLKLEKSLKAGTTSIEIPIPTKVYESEIYEDNIQYGFNGPTKGQYRAVITAETTEGSDCNAFTSLDFAVVKPVYTKTNK